MNGERLWFLEGGGISGETARSVDWAKTPLGSPASWPIVLQATLATMFRSRQPMFLWWGPELLQFYNDAYLPSFGYGKHPHAMGQRGRQCWQEIWPIIGPQIEEVMTLARGTWHEDALVPIDRNGRIEEVYWTYSYSPVFDGTGGVGGTLVICTETTNRVIGQRRTRSLHDLVRVTSNVREMSELRDGVSAVLRDSQRDIPFAILCSQTPTGGLTGVLSAVGMTTAQAEAFIEKWSLHHQESGSALFHLEGEQVWTPSGEIVREAYLAHCLTDAPVPRCAFLFGVSPGLAFNEPYRHYLEQIAATLGTAKSRILEVQRRETMEQERQSLLEQAPFATAVLVGPDQIFESANSKFVEMVGQRDVVGRPYLEVFPDLRGSAVQQLVQEVFTTGKSVVWSEFRVDLDRGKGKSEECYFSFAIEPVRDLDRRVKGMMAVAVDITEQVVSRRVLERVNEEREELLDSLKEASQAKDEFLAILGHELRNPLAPMLTALRLMREKGDSRTLREQDVMERQVNHLIRLVSDLLDVSKIARGKVELRKEYVDLRDVAQKAVEMVSDLFEERHHHISFHTPEEKLVCHGDPVRLAQIVTNLLTNSARYTEPGGRIELNVSRQGDQLHVSVQDNGIGISEEMLPLVFSLFKQASRSADRSEGGLGIGLTLVHNLVTLHGGTVSAYSDGLGSGSRFVARFPAADELQSAREQSQPELEVARNPKRVLLVDDNVDAVELLAEVISRKGHQVVSVTEPLQALDVASEFLPDCAVLDIGLPVVDGYELATRLRGVEGCQNCRLIALSGYGSPEDLRKGRRAGFEEHLVKPVDLDRLLKILDDVSNGPQPLSG